MDLYLVTCPAAQEWPPLPPFEPVPTVHHYVLMVILPLFRIRLKRMARMEHRLTGCRILLLLVGVAVLMLYLRRSKRIEEQRLQDAREVEIGTVNRM